jgi:iron(III) transport system substrate-binding protein
MKSGMKRLRIVMLWSFLATTLICGVLMTGCKPASRESTVVIYTSQDEEYADPIFHDFEKQTGIHVKAVYDSEAVKTVGLVNRLLAESSNPQCDIFWNNEELRTRLLAARHIFRETNGWVLMGYRTRRMVINTNLLSMAKAPKRFSDATNAMWSGKVALAYPLFGTTATHFLALRQYWGDEKWQAWCRALWPTNRSSWMEIRWPPSRSAAARP